MTTDHIVQSGINAASAGRPEGVNSGSAGDATPFAEVRQDAKLSAVRPLFRSPSIVGTEREGRSAIASSSGMVPFAEGEQQVEQAGVRRMAGAAAPEPELSGTGFTYRHNWGARHGQWLLALNWEAVNPRSRVLVSIAEGAAGGPDNGKFIGAARYTVYNVAPRAGGVDIWVNIEWGSDILLYVDYLVINP